MIAANFGEGRCVKSAFSFFYVREHRSKKEYVLQHTRIPTKKTYLCSQPLIEDSWSRSGSVMQMQHETFGSAPSPPSFGSS